ncbi:MAG: hypothetical protein HY302_11820 [Opitutae bacterium]|nr:hypothetical protein [Opitutae bacterium]
MKSNILAAVVTKFAESSETRLITIDLNEVAKAGHTTKELIELAENEGFGARVTTDLKDQVCIAISRR